MHILTMAKILKRTLYLKYRTPAIDAAIEKALLWCLCLSFVNDVCLLNFVLICGRADRVTTISEGFYYCF